MYRLKQNHYAAPEPGEDAVFCCLHARGSSSCKLALQDVTLSVCFFMCSKGMTANLTNCNLTASAQSAIRVEDLDSKVTLPTP